MSGSFPNAVFLKVDVDSCQVNQRRQISSRRHFELSTFQDEAEQYKITAMPTFVLVRNSKELERIRGADSSAIEQTLKKYYKETAAFAGQGHSMLDSNEAVPGLSMSISASESERLEKAAEKYFAAETEGETLTTIRLRLPGVSTPANIRLGINRTLNEIRQLICETITSFQITTFEFMQPPAMKINFDDEKKTIQQLKLSNSVLSVRKTI